MAERVSKFSIYEFSFIFWNIGRHTCNSRTCDIQNIAQPSCTLNKSKKQISAVQENDLLMHTDLINAF